MAWHWKMAFEKRGHLFEHFGQQEIGNVAHVRQFPKAAFRHYQKIKQKPDILLVHEPTSGAFIGCGIKTIVVSHGLERRAWQIQNKCQSPDLPGPSLKARLFFPLWRLRGCDVGLRNADGVLLLNQEDKAFAMSCYGVKESKILVFKNGINLPSTSQLPVPENIRSVLFIGTWLERKGVKTLARAARDLHEQGANLNWVLAGTGLSSGDVLKTWPECLHRNTVVVPRFSGLEEESLYQSCNTFVLPSFFEGQPLALLQAMAHGRCCITTNVCGQKDIIKHRSNGLLFNSGDAQSLGSLIKASTANLQLQIDLGAGAQHTVKDMAWNTVTDEVVDFVEEIYRS